MRIVPLLSVVSNSRVIIIYLFLRWVIRGPSGGCLSQTQHGTSHVLHIFVSALFCILFTSQLWQTVVFSYFFSFSSQIFPSFIFSSHVFPSLVYLSPVFPSLIFFRFRYSPEGLGTTLTDRWDHPVVHVSQRDALAFCAWVDGRLPYEGEWEVLYSTLFCCVFLFIYSLAFCLC